MEIWRLWWKLSGELEAKGKWNEDKVSKKTEDETQLHCTGLRKNIRQKLGDGKDMKLGKPQLVENKVAQSSAE